MNYLEYHNGIKKLFNQALSYFMDFRFTDPEDPEYDKPRDLINDVDEQKRKMEDEMYAKYGCGVDRIVMEKCKGFTEAVDEAIPLRDLWHSFDSSSTLLHPDIVHPVAAEMLLSSPKWFVHMNAPEKVNISNFDKFTEEMKANYKAMLELEHRWIYEPDRHHIPHLYNTRTGISCCGKSTAINITQIDMFSSEFFHRKCKLCLQTKIGRILK